MDNVLSVYKSKLLSHKIVVDAKYNDLREIKVHAGEIVQVFSNVVSNAIDAMPHEGRLTISIAPLGKAEDGGGLQIAVTDSGIGIRREDLGRVFEPFFTTKGNLGTGIGLWVARQLVERHGGRISLSSSTRPDDSGTNVTVYLPFSSQSKLTQANGSDSGTEAR
jgi:signal transduction histidine kinase